MNETVARFLTRRHTDPTIFRVATIVVVFVLVLLAGAVMHVVAGNVSDGVRAYVRGEGLWAKAQKDMVLHLIEYAHSSDEATFRKYEDALVVIRGDHQARLALQADPPDPARARDGFLRGRNDPEDVEVMISFFLYFQHFPYMSEAIAIWSEADAEIDRFAAVAADLKQELSTTRNPRRIQELHERVHALNDELHMLENRFSSVLSQGARWVKTMTAYASVFALLVFTGAGVVISGQIIRGISRDLDLRRAMEDEIRRQAQEDPLTGLGNRNQFHARCREQLLLAEREDKFLALLYMDLDRFKPVNDTYGHETGDNLLRRVAEILRECSRKSDVVARLGGDEFAILAVHPDTPDVVSEIAKRIIAKVRAPKVINGHTIDVGISIGIAVYPLHGRDVPTLMRCADQALYDAKASGRMMHRFFGDGRNA
ncbi:MAG: diguanylate cyclase [Alphaproteobacteria bacterium]|nr:diguanylate cyclase [Alphaproteobacteria bacterium]